MGYLEPIDSSQHLSPVGDDGSEFVSNLVNAQGPLHAFLVSMLPGTNDVDDILQRANMVLWKKKDEYDASRPFKPWAMAIVYWEARAWMTERKRDAWLVIDDDLVSSIIEQFSREPEVPANADVSALQNCLGKLRDQDRILVLSHHQHKKSLRECGEIFKRTPESLKVSLVRIRAALRRCISSQLALEELNQS